jgi:peptide chain release factor 1
MATAAPDLRHRLREIEERFEAVEVQLSDPTLGSQPEELRKVSKLHSELLKIVQRWRELQDCQNRLGEARTLAQDSDPDFAEMAREEITELETRIPQIEADIEILLLPRDPLDDKNIVVEIRAGTGGDEAALFAGDLLRLYTRYAERKGWKVDLLSSSPTELNGFKEVIFSVTGERVYSLMKFEAGGHRVQRIPATEAQGRIHTSAATVAVMPEAEEVDVVIRNEDLRVDVYRSGGPGGQSVNTTDSAVRITHVPTGLVVQCQDEKSQIKNKAKALKVLRSRLLEREIQKQRDEQAAARKGQVGSGDRSERIRTYNFPQNRLTDHRINLTVYNLDRVMEGELDAVVDALVAHDHAERLRGELA